MSVVLIHGDCRAVMRSMPAGSVDLICADPPYGETDLQWDQQVEGWLPEALRVIAPHGSLWCFGSQRFFLERAADFSDWIFAQDVVWEKHNGSSSHADRFKRVHEIACQFYPKVSRWSDVYKAPQYTNDATKRHIRRKQRPAHWGDIGSVAYKSTDGGPRLVRSVIYERSCHGAAIHRTQKPVGLLKTLISYSCAPGGLVLDPFGGSGSTGVAAYQAGRRAVIVEQSKEHWAAAHQRLMFEVGAVELCEAAE